MALGSCQCHGKRCVISVHTGVVFGGRPGNLQHGPLDTRYLTSTEKYREWGTDLNGQRFDYSATVVWQYSRWRAVIPRLTLLGARSHEMAIGDTVWFTGPDNPLWPLAKCDPTKTTNTHMEVHIRGSDDTYGSAGANVQEFNLDATRDFSDPIDYATVYAKARECHLAHGPAELIAKGDIVVAGRSLRRYKSMLNYCGAFGEKYTVIDAQSAPAGALVGTDYTYFDQSHPNCCVWMVPGTDETVQGALSLGKPYCRGDLFRSANFERDFGDPGLTSDRPENANGSDTWCQNPVMVITWSVIPDRQPDEDCLQAFAWPTFSHFTDGEWFRTHRRTIDYSDIFGAGTESPCTETLPTGVREIVWDPQPPADPPTTGYREYGTAGRCPT